MRGGCENLRTGEVAWLFAAVRKVDGPENPGLLHVQAWLLAEQQQPEPRRYPVAAFFLEQPLQDRRRLNAADPTGSATLATWRYWSSASVEKSSVTARLKAFSSNESVIG